MKKALGIVFIAISIISTVLAVLGVYKIKNYMLDDSDIAE